MRLALLNHISLEHFEVGEGLVQDRVQLIGLHRPTPLLMEPRISQVRQDFISAFDVLSFQLGGGMLALVQLKLSQAGD